MVCWTPCVDPSLCKTICKCVFLFSLTAVKCVAADVQYIKTGTIWCMCQVRCVFVDPEVRTWAVRRTRIPLSCWGPGVMLPSCGFRGGRRHTLPEICSACAHTGSQSTDTSTTTRYNKQTHTQAHHVSRCWHISRGILADVSYVGVPVFVLSLLWVDFINVPQSTRLHCIPSSVSPEYNVCVFIEQKPTLDDFLPV